MIRKLIDIYLENLLAFNMMLWFTIAGLWYAFNGREDIAYTCIAITTLWAVVAHATNIKTKLEEMEERLNELKK